MSRPQIQRHGLQPLLRAIVFCARLLMTTAAFLANQLLVMHDTGDITAPDSIVSLNLPNLSGSPQCCTLESHTNFFTLICELNKKESARGHDNCLFKLSSPTRPTHLTVLSYFSSLLDSCACLPHGISFHNRGCRKTCHCVFAFETVQSKQHFELVDPW